jgi:hypothetical protein
VRRRSWHVHLLLYGALLVLGWWGIARVAVCWGRYGWTGTLSCHSHWGAFTILLAAGGAFLLLMYEISELTISEVAPEKRLRRTRAAWRGYRSLEGVEFAHVTAAMALLLAFMIGFAWLVFLSEVRF